MIDSTREELYSLRDAGDLVPHRRAGKRPATATLYRWATRGLRGVKLETLQVGGTMCTSAAALQRFYEKLTPVEAVKSRPDGFPAPVQLSPPMSRHQVGLEHIQAITTSFVAGEISRDDHIEYVRRVVGWLMDQARGGIDAAPLETDECYLRVHEEPFTEPAHVG